MQLISSLNFETKRMPWTNDDAEPVEVTLLCADVVGFTEMTERLGDCAALKVMRLVAGTIRELASRHRGEVLEIRGDAFLLAFASPRQGVRCAIRVMRALALGRSSHAGEAVRLRIALHTGTVVRDGEGYFGRSLILAYRLLGQVAAGCIAMTPTTVDQLPDRWRVRAPSGGSFHPKGFHCELRYVLLERTASNARSSAPSTAPVELAVN
jgi:class 3 adenylate cyclase